MGDAHQVALPGRGDHEYIVTCSARASSNVDNF